MPTTRRSFRRSFRRRRRPVVWDAFDFIADLPGPSIADTDGTNPVGQATGLVRYTQMEAFIKRWIMDTAVQLTYSGTAPSTAAVLELCIGLGVFDMESVTDGQGLATPIAAGTGPLDDADNNKWFARCCVMIPLGEMLATTNAATNPVFPEQHGWLWYVQTSDRIFWKCHIDTKSGRKLQGLQTPWVTVVLQGAMSVALPASASIECAMLECAGRYLLAPKMG